MLFKQLKYILLLYNKEDGQIRILFNEALGISDVEIIKGLNAPCL